MIEYTPIDGYKTFNYAQLFTRGLTGLFDVLRYENAFLARKADIDSILNLTKNGERIVTQPMAFLLCKYDWKGPTKANWTEQRLLSTMELERINDMQKLFDLGVEEPAFRPQNTRKFRAICEVTGLLPSILTTMFLNKAMPYTEKDAHDIEQALYRPDVSFTVKLTNFLAAKTPWITGGTSESS